MPGPMPKDPSVRARFNRTRSSTRTVLSSVHDIKAPPLPDGVEWFDQTRDWWRDLWASGMAPEYIDVHRHGLFRFALMVNAFWDPKTELKQKLEIQVRLEKAEADYGCNPMALRRLEWQIVETKDKQSKSAARDAVSVKSSRKSSGDARRGRLSSVG